MIKAFLNKIRHKLLKNVLVKDIIIQKMFFENNVTFKEI